MKEPTREKILKLLELTASESDGEALNALRKINELMIREDVRWPDFFRGSAPQSALPPTVRPRAERPKMVTVEMMLTEILKRSMSDLLSQKIEEIRYVYELTGQLSGDEASMLINTYNGHLS